MQNNKTKVALIYDFDETLSTQYMQDFCLIPQFGMTPDEFWAKANQWSRENGADQVTGSMYYFMKTAKDFHCSVVAETINDTSSYQVTFADEEGTSTTRRFDKVEVSARGKLLFNQITASLEAMGHSISEQEKRQILMEVLKKLC